MSQQNWEKLAQKQFEKMPASFQNDWKELRHKIYKD
jgi:hypothetical protein